MKHATGPRRGRPRGNGKRFSSGGGGKNQNFESTGPDVKIRGTAQQVYEKYLSLGRDALSAGDRIMAEGFFQFADHYFRIVNATNGNPQGRNDRGPRIPPPPEAPAGRILIDDGAVLGPDSESGSGSTESDGREHDSRDTGREPPTGEDDGEPRQAGDGPPNGTPEAQAKELADALARADSEGGATSDGAPAPLDASVQKEAGTERPRRRRSANGPDGRRSAVRRSQPAEAAAVAAERAESASAGDAKPQPAKRGRGRPRKSAAKNEETAGETV